MSKLVIRKLGSSSSHLKRMVLVSHAQVMGAKDEIVRMQPGFLPRTGGLQTLVWLDDFSAGFTTREQMLRYIEEHE